MIESLLQDIGLSKRESRCYVSLIKLGPSKVGEIVKKTEIPSSKIYEVLNKLINKGFVTYIIRGRIKYFQASDPNFLLNYIDEKRRTLKEIVPQLLLKQRSSEKQKVEIFEGQKAIFSLFTDIIQDAKPKEPYLIFSINEENKNESANFFFRSITLRRKEKKLDVRLLKNIKYYKKERHSKLNLKFTIFDLPQGITVFRDDVILLSWVESPIAVKIKSKIFSSQFRNFFLELWEIAKK